MKKEKEEGAQLFITGYTAKMKGLLGPLNHPVAHRELAGQRFSRGVRKEPPQTIGGRPDREGIQIAMGIQALDVL